ncbi:MAG: ABC transporter permease, partial [Peptococcaceae bacterium]|nr:ABC transporter permease [Peptococcaceae bacterium]
MLYKRLKTNYCKTILKGITFPFLLIVAWEIAARLGYLNALFLPAPTKIWYAFVQMVADGSWAENLLASLQRLAYGFLITVCLAVPLGLAVGKAKNFQNWVNPTLSFLQQIPPIAWIPIFILALGIYEAPKIAVIIYAAFFPVFLNTVQGVKSVDPKLVEVGRAYMLSPLRMIRQVYIPSAYMSIFVGLRLGLSNCWRALVMAEMITRTTGIGAQIWEGRDLMQPDRIFVAVFTIGLVGLIIDIFLKRMECKFMPWKR